MVQNTFMFYNSRSGFGQNIIQTIVADWRKLKCIVLVLHQILANFYLSLLKEKIQFRKLSLELPEYAYTSKSAVSVLGFIKY